MFKKTLVAAALTAVTAFGANATVKVTTSATTTDKAYDISSQGLPLTKAFTLADVIVTLSPSEASALTAGSKVRLTFTGALVSTAPATAVAYADVTPTGGTANDNTFAGNKDGDGDVNGTVGSFGAANTITATSTTVTVPFAAAPVDGDTDDGVTLGSLIDGDTIRFQNIPLLLNSADVKSTVSVTASIVSASNVVIPSTTSAATKVIDVVDQFTTTIAAATDFDADIDVANERKTFTGKLKTDDMVITGTTTGTGATAVSAKVTVKGDYSDDITKLSDGTNSYVINTAKTEATFTYTTSSNPTVASFLSGNTTLTATVDGVDAIAARSFKTSVDLSYTDAESAPRTQALLTDAASGAWKLNGDSSAHVSFMPFGDAFSQSITVANTGSVDGEITIDWYYEGKVITTVLKATAKAKGVTDISAEMREVAKANGITGNAAFDVIVNSPAGQINVSALYYSKADADRGIVLSEAASGQ